MTSLRGKIPYPERFNEMMDYKQNAVIQMKDVLYTREDWILRGRLYYTIPEHRDNEGQELYISMEGVPLREPEIIDNTPSEEFSELSAGGQQYDGW